MKTVTPIFSAIVALFMIALFAGAALAGPDLVVSRISLSPESPVQGEPVTVKVTVYNRGDQRCGPFTVQWKPGENYGSPACRWRAPGLAARGGRVLTCRYEGYPSRYSRINCLARVDPNGEVDERDEGNNVARKGLRVLQAREAGGKPDLYVSEFSISPSTPVKGEPVTVRIGVYNRGNARSGPFLAQWLPGENYTRPAQQWRINSLPARGGKILTFRYPGYPSWYSRLNTMVVVDPNNEVEESNEGNNRRQQRIRVARP